MIYSCFGDFDILDYYCYECPWHWQCEDYTEYFEEDYC